MTHIDKHVDESIVIDKDDSEDAEQGEQPILSVHLVNNSTREHYP